MKRWSASVKSVFNRAFPERQIYHRSGGTVRYISISPWQQAIMAAAAVGLALWTLFATGMYVLGGSSIGAGGAVNERQLAEYERWVEELRTSNATTKSLLEQQQDSMDSLMTGWEDRHNVLEGIVEKLQSEDGLEISALKGNNSGILVRASIEEADNRQSRQVSRTLRSIDVGTRAKAKESEFAQTELLNKLEDIAVERAEKARGVLVETSIGSNRILGGREMGGPLVGLNTINNENMTPFELRSYQVEARLTEALFYENVVRNLPLGAPVGDNFRHTSPYGLRVDPFNKRPAWHNGIDLAAYRNAPIISAGPGKVTFAGKRSGYGRMVEIDHGYGFKSRYAHLRKILVKKGEEIETGTEVGKMGTSGRSTGDHLHYEVWFEDKPYDPKKFMKAGRYVHKK